MNLFQVTSYGGDLTYRVFYDSRSGASRLSSGADVKMYGNGRTLFATHFTRPFVGVEASARIPLLEVGIEKK